MFHRLKHACLTLNAAGCWQALVREIGQLITFLLLLLIVIRYARLKGMTRGMRPMQGGYVG